ncbi:MAG: acetamidase/formamidase family protein [Calditrichia bacterium]
MRYIMLYAIAISIFLLNACNSQDDSSVAEAVMKTVPEAQFTLTTEQTHNKFSSAIPPAITVPSGAVIEVFTEEASDGQIKPGDGPEVLATLEFDPIHPLTGPVFVEGAMPGDVLKVTLHKIEVQDWGWTAILPGFSFLADQFTKPWLKTYEMSPGAKYVDFSEDIRIPLSPFPGVMGVAPATEEMLSTIPPRENGGNMDDPHLVEGTSVYFPVFVEGALFSIGDAHATQGMGEVCGTAIEIPMHIVYQVDVLKGGRQIPEPEYEGDDYYAVTAVGTSLDIAAKKAVGFMVDYLVKEHKMDRNDAYALCSLAGDLKIAEVVDLPNMLVAMHMPKSVLGMD